MRKFFYPLSQAYGFKPQNNEEKKLHEENMEKLLFNAAMVPLDIMKEALQYAWYH